MLNGLTGLHSQLAIPVKFSIATVVVRISKTLSEIRNDEVVISMHCGSINTQMFDT